MFFCGATYHEKEICEYVLLRLRTQWNQLHTRFGTTYPLKIHIMLSHANDYVELVGGGLSKRGNDQVTEAAHQYLRLEWKNLVIGKGRWEQKQREKDFIELSFIPIHIIYKIKYITF